jgi:hypothetical protein
MSPLYGVDSNKDLRPLLVDSSGRAIVVAPAGGVEINPGYGNVLLAYADVVRESIDNLDLSSGTNLLNTSDVPSGYVWRIENIGIKYTGTTAGVTLDAQIISGALIMGLFGKAPPVSSEFEERQGCWTLAAGENLRLAVTGATAHDQARLRVVGSMFAVA